MTRLPEGIDSLQFETAVPVAGLVAQQPAHAVTCGACQQPIASAYFDVNGQPVCQACQDQMAQHFAAPRGAGVMIRALLFGVSAAIVGAILYFAVVAITGFEIGIAAIAIGYIVGYAIRRATAGRGGRRFQVAAVLLTYWAVGLAYTPLLVKSAFDARRNNVDRLLGDATERATVRPSPATAPAAGAPTSASPEASAAVPPPAGRVGDGPAPSNLTVGRLGLFVVLLFLLPLVLPVLTVISSLPGGLLSGAIIGFGMKQAWAMTGALPLVISGPYRIAPPDAAA